MPHFVVDCSECILRIQTEEQILLQLHGIASASMLFEENEIKVRVNPFKTYSVGNKKEAFIHVFASIMEGRRTEQKADLANAIVRKLVSMFPDVPNIAMNVSEFERATYCNRSSV